MIFAIADKKLIENGKNSTSFVTNNGVSANICSGNCGSGACVCNNCICSSKCVPGGTVVDAYKPVNL